MSVWSSTTRSAPVGVVGPGGRRPDRRIAGVRQPPQRSLRRTRANSGWSPDIPAAGRWSRPSGKRRCRRRTRRRPPVPAPSVVTEPPASGRPARRGRAHAVLGPARFALVAASAQHCGAVLPAEAYRDTPIGGDGEGVGEQRGTTCPTSRGRRRAGSPRSGQSRSSQRPACSIAGRNMSTRPVVSGARSMGQMRVHLPAYSRESSSSRSTIRRRRCAICAPAPGRAQRRAGCRCVAQLRDRAEDQGHGVELVAHPGEESRLGA